MSPEAAYISALGVALVAARFLLVAGQTRADAARKLAGAECAAAAARRYRDEARGLLQDAMAEKTAAAAMFAMAQRILAVTGEAADLYDYGARDEARETLAALQREITERVGASSTAGVDHG